MSPLNASHLHHLYANSGDCIKVIDCDGRIRSLNDKGADLLQLDDARDILGSVWVEFWKDEGREAAERAVLTAWKGEIASFEGYCPTSKGEDRWWDVVVVPVRDKDGQVNELMAISRDITERKTAHHKLEAMNQALVEKNRELENRQEELSRAENMLERLLAHTERHTR